MKKKAVFAAIAICVLAIAVIWAVNQYDTLQRERVHHENKKLLEQIDSINQRSALKADSLKKFNPDPLLTVYENIQRSNELISHIAYTKKMLGERVYKDLIKSPDDLLLSEPGDADPAEVFIGSDRDDGYTKSDLMDMLDSYVWFQNKYGEGDTAEIEKIMQRLNDLEECDEDGYKRYASLITDLNRLILAVEKLKMRELKV